MSRIQGVYLPVRPSSACAHVSLMLPAPLLALILACAVAFAAVLVPAPARAAVDTSGLVSISTAQVFAGKSIAVETGSPIEGQLSETGAYDLHRFDDAAGALYAMQAGTAAAAAVDDSVARLFAHENGGGYLILGTGFPAAEFGVVTGPKGERLDLLNDVNAFIADFVGSAEYNEMVARWLQEDLTGVMIPSDVVRASRQGTGAVLRVATLSDYAPFEFVGEDGSLSGFDVEFAMRLAAALDRPVEFVTVGFTALFETVTSGKSDLAIAALAKTDERDVSYGISEAYLTCTSSFIAKNGSAAPEQVSLYEALANSFYNNLIKENRFLLVLNGLWVTLVISVGAQLLGTVMGMGICALHRGKNAHARRFAKGFIALFQGVPLLVLLMIMYYIIFGKIDLSGVSVAIVAFSLVSAANNAEIFRVSIDGVDKGEVEAARALGMRRSQVFTRVVLPQAARTAMPLYRACFVGLMKNTSVVGYVAISDLTKAGDIIRSRTYEAFFPLIFIAVIYFLLAWTLSRLLAYVEKRLEPNGRRRRAAASGRLRALGARGDGRCKDASAAPAVSSAPASTLACALDPVASSSPADPGPGSDPVFSICHLQKRFGDTVVLSDVSADVMPGDVISIIGPSGSGKSTLLRALNLLDPPCAGQIVFRGKDITDPATDIAQVRERVGMVFQRFNLFSHLMAVENVMLAPMLVHKMSRSEAFDEASALLAQVGLGEKLYAYPDELSGGQQQRVAIARTLAMHPEVVLFDEPTSALDPTMVEEVLAVIRSLAEQGLTMLIVTHEMKFAESVSSRAFFMCDGVIYEDGTSAQVFDHPAKPKTRAFIRHIRTFCFAINTPDYDFLALVSGLQRFGEKSLFSPKRLNIVQLAVEELVSGLLIPADAQSRAAGEGGLLAAELAVEAVLDNEKTIVTLTYGGSDRDIASPKGGDGLSSMILQWACESIAHTYDSQLGTNTVELVL